MEQDEPTTTIAAAELQRIAAQMETLPVGKEEAEKAATASAAAAAHAVAPNRAPLKHPSAPPNAIPQKRSSSSSGPPTFSR